MKLRKLTECKKTDCPAVYISDRGTAVVQGIQVAEAEGLTLGAGETAVEVPPDIVLSAVRELRKALQCS